MTPGAPGAAATATVQLESPVPTLGAVYPVIHPLCAQAGRTLARVGVSVVTRTMD